MSSILSANLDLTITFCFRSCFSIAWARAVCVPFHSYLSVRAKMTVTVAHMPLHISVQDSAASITESENGIMLKLPVSLNLPITELLAALELVQRDQVLKTLQSEHRQDSESAPPPPMPPPPMSDVEWQFRLPGDLLDNAKWHEMCSSGAQTFTSLHGRHTYDIRSSTKKWILDQQDFAVLDDLNIQRKEPVPMKRMAPTPKVDDLAAVEARAEEAFKKAMAMPLSFAATSSVRLPPETPPPASSLPPVSHPMTFKDSGPDEAAIIRSRGSDEADPMKRPVSAVAVPMPGHGGDESWRTRTYAEPTFINALNVEANYLMADRITGEEPGGLQGKRTRRGRQSLRIRRKQSEAQNQSGPEDAATDAEAEATPGDVAEAEAAAADQTGSTGSTEELGTPQWNKQRKDCKQQ